MKYICVIPARFDSSRFPGKILASLGGAPMMIRTWLAACATKRFDRIIIALDSPEAAAVATEHNADWLMTPTTCDSGTDRIAYLLTHDLITLEKHSVIINWQCDEPFITRSMIDDLLHSTYNQIPHESQNIPEQIWTLKKKITNPNEITARNVAKIVTDARGDALYFSRSQIPLVRDVTHDKPYGDITYYKHIGLYAYMPEILKRIAALAPCESEQAEQLEQLRWLHYGLRIRVHETQQSPIAIDTPQDLARAEHYLQTSI